jgi:hypothetical protein
MAAARKPRALPRGRRGSPASTPPAEPVTARPLLPPGSGEVGGGGYARTAGELTAYGLHEGTPVILFLRDPKDKVWGLLVSLGPAGVTVRGMDLRTFEEWMRQEARRDEDFIGPSTMFFPMHRLDRVERDESVGMVISFADRFHREVGRTVNEAMGIG